MRTALATLALLLAACGAPTCPPPSVKLDGPATLTVEDGGFATALLGFHGGTQAFLFDTGFDRTSLDPSAADGVNLSKVSFAIGQSSVGPVQADVLLSPLGKSVIGNDVLHQLPLIFDPQAGTIDVRPSFGAPSEDAVPIDFVHSDACRDDDAKHGAAGPYAMLVPVAVDGRELNLLLDTGADVTFIRKSTYDLMNGRSKLSSIKVGTAFAGIILASATRAKTIAIGSRSVSNAAVFAASAADDALNARQAQYSDLCKCTKKVDGLLGWNVLRNFRVSLAEAKDANNGRTLQLEPLTGTNWPREFIGVGAYFSNSDAPSGLKIDSFLSRSPAKDAGLAVGDVITKVNGQPALQAPIPFAPAGTQVAIEAQHGSTTLNVNVTVEDLLPDPP
ncbi:MAG: retroviral-like aspartic protease family protein [Myxococcaceae bacterium]